MHELSVAQSILAIALESAGAERFEHITRIRVVVGALTTYVDESIRFYWTSIPEGTAAGGATVEFVHDVGKLLCLTCNLQFSTMILDFQCPHCGGLWTQSLAGGDCYVESIEVECLDSSGEREAVCQ